MNNGVAYFLYSDKKLVNQSIKLLEHEGISAIREKVPEHLYSQCELCMKTSITDSFTVESLLDKNDIFIDSVHKEVDSWN